MATKRQSILYTICVSCSIILNIFTVNHVLFNGESKLNWTRKAVKEAEEVAAISCSGHGRVFLDGSVQAGHAKPACECNACYGRPDCSQFSPHDCVVDADSGDPMFLEPFWMSHAAESAVVVAGWHRMSYEYKDGSLISQQLETQIRRVHDVVGNAVTKGRFIVFGAGATQLLNAAVHALSSGEDSPFFSRVVASTPYYPVYREQTEFFESKNYKFEGDTSLWMDMIEDCNNKSFVELVTSPNNPDGELNKAILHGPCVSTIHDLAYYWPHFTPIPSPANEDLMIFSLSKFTGHAGSRFGWTIVKDEKIYKRMLDYISLSTYGVSKETQLRVLKLVNVVIDHQGKGSDIFQYGDRIMKDRWKKLSTIFSKSQRFSIQNLEPRSCSFVGKSRRPSPAFAWIRCEREEDKDCYEVFKKVNVIGRSGSLFGAKPCFVRLSIVKGQDDFDLLLQRLKVLMPGENINTRRKDIYSYYNEPASQGTVSDWRYDRIVTKQIFGLDDMFRNDSFIETTEI